MNGVDIIARYEDAAATLKLLPLDKYDRPREFGSIMPQPLRERDSYNRAGARDALKRSLRGVADQDAIRRLGEVQEWDFSLTENERRVLWGLGFGKPQWWIGRWLKPHPVSRYTVIRIRKKAMEKLKGVINDRR